MTKYLERGIGGSLLKSNCLNWVSKQANHLKINGCASFKEDGSIKIVAEGEENNLFEFADKLQAGHFFSKTENFYVIWKESDKKFNNFSIIY